MESALEDFGELVASLNDGERTATLGGACFPGLLSGRGTPLGYLPCRRGVAIDPAAWVAGNVFWGPLVPGRHHHAHSGTNLQSPTPGNNKPGSPVSGKSS